VLRDGVARMVPVNSGIMTSDLIEAHSGVASGNLLIESGGTPSRMEPTFLPRWERKKNRSENKNFFN